MSQLLSAMQIKWKAAMLLVLACVLLLGPSSFAQTAPEPIFNTAYSAWSVNGQDRQAASNTVEIARSTVVASIDTFAADSSGGSQNYYPSACSATSGQVPASVGSQSPSTIGLRATQTYYAGDTLYFRVDVANANIDDGAIDRVIAVITSDTGDRESIVVFETGTDTGVFVGAIRTAATPPAPVLGDCVLSVAAGEDVSIAILPVAGATPILTTSVVIAVPLPPSNLAVEVTKVASRTTVMPGDAIIYAITVTNPDQDRPMRGVVVTDTPDRALRLRPGTVRIDGEPAGNAATITSDGRTITVTIAQLAPGQTRRITYAMTVRADAAPGDAENVVTAANPAGDVSKTGVSVRIEREIIAGRMTLIGRVTAGDCTVRERRLGIPGVRVMLEDGSFALTDADGRYHFEGVMPGTHVVQAAPQTLPADGEFVDCTRNTRSAGKANSRFVTGQGGSLVVVDFAARLPEAAIAEMTRVKDSGERPEEKRASDDASAAGGDTDWVALGDGPDGFLFPATDHNPRAPVVRAVVRHRIGQTVELTSGGKPVSPVTFDGMTKSADGAYAVSTWRAIPIEDGRADLLATIRNADGSVALTQERDVRFSNVAARAEFVPSLSRLIADGASRPVLAVRMLDRNGRPVHDGMSGEVRISEPYESAQAIDMMQDRQLTGMGQARPTWHVEGEDGIALIELAPTMVSGALHAEFLFRDGEYERTQKLDTWVEPGDQEWTLVGLAEVAAGAIDIADQMERTGSFDSDLGDNGRVAFYAKGRVLGRFLLTAAYDSAKQRDEQRLLGIIDPDAYYTVFADGSDRRFDAASRDKLYVRIEARGFYAIYGDIETGLVETQLGRYQRTFTGVKAQVAQGQVSATAFAAKTGSSYRRDEIQGNGLTGPYSLSSKAILANSETVTLEVRDRFRSEVVVSSEVLTRYVDYDIDLLTGTITFAYPVLSRDAGLNPQFIVVEYEIDRARGGEMNAGGRADWTSADDKLRIGATLITEKDPAEGSVRRDLGAVDMRYRPTDNTEIRAELAATRGGESGTAWLVEAEHHDGNLDAIAYVRSIDADFGLGQQNIAERGRRKYGVDGRYLLDDALTVTASAWIDESLTDEALRKAGELRLDWRRGDTDLHAAITRFDDSLADGTKTASTVLEGGVSQRLFDNRLQLDATTSVGLGSTGSVDLPARHTLGARYAITNDIRLVGTYEIADGDAIDARTFRAGVEVSPWTGSRMIATLGRQDVAEYGKRSFGAFGIAQSLEVAKGLTLDGSLDGARTLSGGTADQVINPDQPIASGGSLSSGTLVETFTAATLGATLRRDLWTVTARGEIRDGELADRKGLTVGAIRQLGDGQVVGSGFTWTRATTALGGTSEIFDGAIAAAFRPALSEVAGLSKIEYRSDKVTGAVAGEVTGAGNSLFAIDGDAVSRRLIGSVSLNWSPRDDIELDDEGERVEQLRRSEFGLFLGTRYNFDRIEGYDLSTWTLLGGLDARLALGESFEVGGRATVRASLGENTTSFAYGPQVGFTPTDDVLLMVGYNVEGFRDRDFEDAQYTRKGVYVSAKIKFDSDSFRFLGLGR